MTQSARAVRSSFKREKKRRVVAKEQPEVAAKAVYRLNSNRTLDATTEELPKKLRRTDSDILADLDKFEKQVVADIEAEEEKEEVTKTPSPISPRAFVNTTIFPDIFTKMKIKHQKTIKKIKNTNKQGTTPRKQ